MFGFYVIKQYERGVQFRLGRVSSEGAREPGLIFVMPLVNRVRRVSMRIVTLPIQSQGIITRDNVSVGVSAVAYYRERVLGHQPDCADDSPSRRWAPHAR